MSVLLILVSIFGLAAAGLGVKDCMNIKEYKEEEKKEAEVVSDLEDAIVLLQENEEAYLDGIGAYSKGLSDYNSGKSELNKGYKDYDVGKKAYEQGKKTYEDGLKAYEQGKKDLEAGKKRVAEGQALIDANTEAYLEGKAKLEQLEPLMGYLDTYLQFRDGVLSKISGFSSAQIWFVTIVRPIAANLGLEIPLDVTDFPAYMQKMVAEGEAQIKEYEDGLAELEAGKAQVAAGEAALKDAEAQLAAGKKELKAGEKELKAGESKLKAGERELKAGAAKLADGKASLEEFEDGMRQVDGYLMEIYTQPTVYRHNGDVAIPNPELALGEKFDWYKHNDNGEVAALRNGDPYIDLDNAMEVCKAFRTYVSDQGDDVAAELYARLGVYIAIAVASLLGIVAAVLAISGKMTMILGVIVAILGLGANVFGLCTSYLGYTYPLDNGAYSGSLQLIALVFFMIVAVCFAVASILDKANAKSKA